MYERLDEITLAEQEVAERYDHTVNVCMAAGCMSSQSGAIKELSLIHISEPTRPY